MTHPDHTDELRWLQRLGPGGARVLAVIAALALLFTMVNVQQFAAGNHPVQSFHWWISWLLDPMAALTMATAIVFEWTLASYGRHVGWLTVTKWFAGGSTLLMNIWSSLFGETPSPSGVVLHLVAPGLLLCLAEAAPRVRVHLAEIQKNLLAPVTQVPDEVERLWVAPTSVSYPTVHATALPAWVRPGSPVADPVTPSTRDDAPTTPVASPEQPAPKVTPAPTGRVTDTLTNQARELKTTRARDGLSCGWRVIHEALPVTQRAAKELARLVNEPTPGATRLERVS